jgi:hypothetical protein
MKWAFDLVFEMIVLVFCWVPIIRVAVFCALIESMMPGKPVVATSHLSTHIRGLCEEVLDEVTGLTLLVKNIVSLTGVIRWMLEAPKWAGLLGLAGSKRALEL